MELKAFQKIMLKRKDMIKWVEHEHFIEHCRGLLVKVVVGSGDYIIAELDELVTKPDHSYRLDNKQSNVYVNLRDHKKKTK